ncbi:leucyl aminopeptidase family protein [Sphingomonas sp. ABOLD]|uniref:Leucyl aminopeptidase n=1 Tax=Sphingomonas trueperi TaxID=53317 RepID=A0A7X5XXZ6_9SPHN|nr:MULTISPECIES: leucyl aminopeptidase family protein [Sphingomonas]NJB97432.1 leucyl aminopeptidase [Sphingomonas trueperi]RSV45940.1 leucyl aminopeptidase family protein [Sphingomonas sp. ABOLD]
MTDLNTLVQPDRGQAARTIHLIDAKGYDAWLAAQPPRHRAAAAAQKLAPVGYASAILPGDSPEDWSVVSVVANVEKLSPWCLAKLAETLPEGSYRVEGIEPGKAIYGWLVAQYKFDRYRKADPKAQGPRVLLTTDPVKMEEAVRMAAVTFKLRDRINTGANDMSPADLEEAGAELAKAYGATFSVVKGDELQQGYGMLHAVGQAAGKGREPRLIELEWGNPEHPRIAIIGKGVCFDSGGLDIKPASGMRLMKKDMGGAAHAFALGELVMQNKLPVRLHLLVPAVENSISGEATRPGDVMISRKGITVENSNTDAEGRLILGDALTKAEEKDPELVFDFATLTGAARVALGADLQALFANDDTLAAEILAAGEEESDPIWRMPLYDPYKDLLKSDVADMVNAAEGPFGGAITAALFLKEFVPAKAQWAHFDIFCWNGSPKPGRPKGAEAVSLRATWKVLKDRYGG